VLFVYVVDLTEVFHRTFKLTNKISVAWT